MTDLSLVDTTALLVELCQRHDACIIATWRKPSNTTEHPDLHLHGAGIALLGLCEYVNLRLGAIAEALYVQGDDETSDDDSPAFDT